MDLFLATSFRPLTAFGACAAAALGLALGARPATAQVRPDSAAADSVIAIDALRVDAARTAATVGGASAVRLRLDSLRLSPATSMDMVLRQVPFVQVRKNSRGEAQLALRGTEARQVAVLVDGVPLTIGWDHRADLSVVPMTGAQSITLVRGLSSVLHGPNVLGGVVEVAVARGPFPSVRPEPLRLSAGVDDLGGRSFGALSVAPFGRDDGDLVLRAGLGYRDRPAVRLPSGVADPASTRAGRRANSDLDNVDGFLALRYRDYDGRWASLSASGFRAERGVPAELHVAQPRYWRYADASRLLVAASGGTGQRQTRLGEGDVEASVGVDVARTEIDSYTGPSYTELDGRESATDRTLSLRLLADHTLGPRNELRMAFTLADTRRDERIDATPVQGSPLETAGYRQRLWSVGAEVKRRLPGRPLGGRISAARVVAGIALDGADTPESGDKPPLDRLWDWGARLGATAMAAGGHVLLHAGVSRRARFPALRELYSGALGRFEPNPALRPELLAAGEAGATARLGSVEVQAVGFHQRLADVIVRTGLGDGRFRRENRDEMRSTGLELFAALARGPASVSGELTVQRVRILDPTLAPGRERRPEYQPAMAGSIDIASRLPLRARGAAGLHLLGRQWCVDPDLGRDVPLDASAGLDLELGRAWELRSGAGVLPRFLETVVSLDNATDTAVYDQCGLPRPGRTLRFQIRLGPGR